MTEAPGVRWNNLFDDLESQLEQELSAEELDFRAEEERLRIGRMSLRPRLAALIGTPKVTILFADDSRLSLQIATVGKDWLGGEVVDSTPRRTQCIIPMTAVAGLDLTAEQIAASLSPEVVEPALSATLALAFALRDLSRRRRAVDLTLGAGALHGTIDRVGRDHFDLAVHERGAQRRQAAVSAMRVIPFSELRLLRL